MGTWEGARRNEKDISGCGAGVQAAAEVFPKAIVVPALNTTFVGETKEAGLWVEHCRGLCLISVKLQR